MADTLAVKIQRAIAAQQSEVDRLTQIVQVELPAAQQRLNQLNTLLTKATPAVETFYANLVAVAILD